MWWKLALVGAGIGCMFAPLTVAVMTSTPPQRAGLGSSMINTTRIAGFTAGAAVLGSIVAGTIDGVQGDPPALREAFVDGFHIVFSICAGCTALALIIAATLMVRGRPASPGPAPAGQQRAAGEDLKAGVAAAAVNDARDFRQPCDPDGFGRREIVDGVRP